MTEHEATRTLVKSPPELWAECSDASSLARHIGQFGEIRITKLEPENAVAWEGTLASGTVRLEPSGWGTRVILTARVAEREREGAPAGAADDAVADVVPGPEAAVEPEATEPGPGAAAPERQPPPRRGLMARLLGWFAGPQPAPPAAPAKPAVARVTPPVAAAVVAPAPPPQPVAGAGPAPGVDHGAVLTAALDSLGQAHHRPFSRS